MCVCVWGGGGGGGGGDIEAATLDCQEREHTLPLSSRREKPARREDTHYRSALGERSLPGVHTCCHKKGLSSEQMVSEISEISAAQFT